MQFLPSTHSGARRVVIATLGALLAPPALAQATTPAFVQGAAFAAGSRVPTPRVLPAAPGSVTPGSSNGIPYTPRAQTSSGSVYEEDITASAAGPQHGTATLGNAVEWYAVCAVFRPYPATPPVPPSTPSGLGTSSVASTRVALSC